jgi:glycerol-1-phosphate dehydrogenase [NAD(P)+]
MDLQHIRALDLAESLELADETRDILLNPRALEEIPLSLGKFFGGSPVCLVADDHTWEAAGKALRDILSAAGVSIGGTFCFPGEPRLHADFKHVETLRAFFASLLKQKGPLPDRQGLVPIAVGSGTLNDLVKRAAYDEGLPYLCAATAASVDGFTANGAALLIDGFKRTDPCAAPRVIAADPEILAKAPAYLSSSGFGDLASKIIAGSDWIIADQAGRLGAPGAQEISEPAWAMIQPELRNRLRASVDAAKGDQEGVKRLFLALALTGLAMQYLKSSRPVSGAEHLYSHIWEMEDLSVGGVPVTHGHKVAIGTLAATALTELFFRDPGGPPPAADGFTLPSAAEREGEVRAAFASIPGKAGVIKVALEKMIDPETTETINRAFREEWKDIRNRVLAQLIPYEELKTLMARAGCPLVPESIGLTRSRVIAATRRAQMIRNRYTILDLIWGMGAMETLLSRLEESAIYLR